MVKKGILYTSGQLDSLNYYSKILPKIKSFLGDREIATKTYIPKSNIPFILHRGSNSPKLIIKDVEASPNFLKKRVGKHLRDIEKSLNEKEKLTARYFVPRKNVELHYAVNYETPRGPIDRIFIDLDSKVSDEKYLEVTKQLLKKIKSDKQLKKLVRFKTKLLWTGAGFHIYLLLNSRKPNSFYEKYFSFKKGSFTNKWAEEISKATKVEVKAAHTRRPGAVILDTSATPSGKLGRAPYSLHLSPKGQINGVSVPIKESDLTQNKINKLKALTPDKALRY